ncbi:MAG: hypothetical protein A2498_16440 [Lentisphaerae bacterium RIFOXYC12_FULL_60_16]|nr:MAG: hypothetical protein A2498_16440 [Lentisphaerae bacterium RIFOXYC12_FULL_60_16]
MRIDFPGYTRSETLADFPALVVLTNNRPAEFAYDQFASPVGNDLRFSSWDGGAELKYEIEQWNTNGASFVWVRIPAFTNGMAIWAYWGNTNVAADPPSFTTNGVVWNSGYLGVWHLQVTNATDSTANGNHASSATAVTPVSSGRVGAACDFVRNNSFISIPDKTAFTLSGPYTVSAWINSDVAGNVAEGFVGTYNGSQGFIFDVNSDGANQLGFWAAGQWRYSGVGITEGQWQHAVYTRNGTNGYFYINGKRVAVINNAVAGNNGTALHIGGGGTGWAANRYDGKIDEVRISNVDRSSNWVWASAINLASNAVFCAYTNLPLRVVNWYRPIGGASLMLGGRLYGTASGWQNPRSYLCWGLSDGGLATGAWEHVIDMGTNAGQFGSFSTNISVSLDTTYFYRSLATNTVSGQSAWAETTASARVGPPEVSADRGATNITATSAWVTVEMVTTNGAPANTWLCWGTVDAGTGTSGWEHVEYLGALLEGVFSHRITGLEPNTAYIYRLVTDNGYGTSTSRKAFLSGPWMLTFTENFDERDLGDMQGQNGWMVSRPAAALVQTNITYGGSARACSLSNVVLQHDFTDPFATNEVWVDFTAKPVFADLYTDTTNATVVFCVHTSGYVKVSSGSTELLLTNGPVIATNTWVQFKIRSDYVARRWDLYVDNNLVASNLLFRYAKQSFTRMDVVEDSFHTRGYVDSVRISRFDPSMQAWGTLIEMDTRNRTNTPLPFTDTFEGYSLGSLNGQGQWNADPSTAVVVQTANRYGGSKAVQIMDASAWHSVSNLIATNVWMDFYIYPTRHQPTPPPDIVSSATAAFYVNRDGYVVALSNANWVTLLTEQIPSNTWQRFTVKLDYVTRRWSLYKAGPSPNAASVLLARDLAFLAEGIYSVRSWRMWQKESTGYLDDIGMAASPPATIDDDGDGIPDIWENQYLGSTTYAAGDDTDGDGVSNFNEWLAASNPSNTVSHLRVTSFGLPDEGSPNLALTWLGGEATVSSPFFAVGDRPGRRFLVLASDNDASLAPATRASLNPNTTGTNAWTDTGAASAPISRYYRVAASHAGYVYTNEQEWALHVQPRKNSNLYMVGMPVDLGTNTNLRGTLGTHLARGLYPSANTAQADRIYVRLTNQVWKEFFFVTNAAGQAMWWDYDTDTNADFTITPVMGVWVDRRSGAPRVRTNAVFTGTSHLTAPPVTFLTNSAVNGWAWSVFSWPFSAPARQINSGIGPTPPNQLGFEAKAYGGQTMDAERPHADKGDQLWVWESNTFKRVYWLMGGVGTNYNGRWWSDRDGTFGNVRLEAGKAYFYRHHVATNGATTGTNFTWQPVR